jgi:RND family efflux transporter MFP subunit
MTYRAGIITGIVFTLAVVGIAWRLLTTDPAGATSTAPPAIPANVPKPFKEESATTVTLTAAAVEQLALQTATIERKPMRRVRVYGGEVVVPDGQTLIVSAPLSGVVQLAAGKPLLPGSAVTNGQMLLQLFPLLTPESRANLAASQIDAEGQTKTAQTQLDAAKIALDRSRQLFKTEAGSRRAVDEAQAEVELRQKMLEAAKARHELLSKVVGSFQSGTASPLDIQSPDNGLLRNVSVTAGQHVPAGAALFEVVNVSRVWVKTPVYVGDVAQIDTTAEATIGELTAKQRAEGRRVKPVSAPPSADPAAGTVDLFYELDNKQQQYTPGQRVAVSLPLRDEAESLTVPWSAIVFDIHGGTWVYERSGETTFIRRRVLVRYVTDGVAILADGPPAGTKIVTAGAAELFGAETGYSK